jgi:hypothetical protein
MPSRPLTCAHCGRPTHRSSLDPASVCEHCGQPLTLDTVAHDRSALRDRLMPLVAVAGTMLGLYVLGMWLLSLTGIPFLQGRLASVAVFLGVALPTAWVVTRIARRRAAAAAARDSSPSA